jgi:hypothetical protein
MGSLLRLFPVIVFAVMALSSVVVCGADDNIDFQRDIRSLLSDRCFACHGPDAKKRKARLRLDTREGVLAERRGRAAVVPGDPSKSELLRRVSTDDTDDRMPPEDAGSRLSTSEIDTLRRWVAAGAPWGKHWAFEAPSRVAAPKVARSSRVTHPVDAFVLARLEQEGVEPSLAADRATLIRRLTFDLTGLPPTLAEIDAFLADESPTAYETVVDRLLDSPRYGERMALEWLDAARYADTNGYQTDGERNMWRWRDWVIDAFNRNMPFDRFTIEQLAGDLLPNPTLDQLIATGFHRNHRGNGEGGVIGEEYLVEYVVDRVDTTSTVWLGMTLGCARCHDHKYDPFSQREFYEVFAFFHNVPEMGRVFKYGNSPPTIPAPTSAQQEELASVDRGIHAAERNFQTLADEIAEATRRWEDELRADGSEVDAKVRRGMVAHVPPAKAPFVEAGDVAAFGFFDRFTISAWVTPRSDKGGTIVSRMIDVPEGTGYALRLEGGKVYVDLVRRWLDDSVRVYATPSIEIGKTTHVAMTYDGSRLASGVRVFIGGVEASLEVDLDELNQSFDSKEPLRVGRGGGDESVFEGRIGEVRVFDRVLRQEELDALSAAEPVSAIAKLPPARRSHSENAKLRLAFLESFGPGPVRAAHDRLVKARERRERLVRSFPTVMIMRERDKPRETFILARGRYDEPGERVDPGVPSALPAMSKDAPRDRLGFARWIVDRRNPLTARVTVNRFWQMFFGAGIVRTTNDFGSQGDAPSHPELLDWLAVRFMESGWDIKATLRTIVTSATYRQSSRTSVARTTRDPDNRLLARGPRFRLSAHAIRDQALAVSKLASVGPKGALIGGPSVRPYQPPGLWKELSGLEYVPGRGAELYRRSLYTYWKRTAPPPAMMAFDAADRESCSVRRSLTNTPLQALVLINDVTFVEAARAFAERILREGGKTDDERLAWGFRVATARSPRARELALLRLALAAHRERFRDRPEEAVGLIAIGESEPDAQLDPCEIAAFAVIASTILNLDEVLTRG